MDEIQNFSVEQNKETVAHEDAQTVKIEEKIEEGETKNLEPLQEASSDDKEPNLEHDIAELPKKKPTGFARKLFKKEQQIQMLQQELEKYRNSIAPNNQINNEPSDQIGKEPEPHDFRDWGEYYRALAKYEAKKEAIKLVEEREQKKQIISQQQRHQQNLKKATLEYPDFEDVILEASEYFNPSLDLGQAIVSSEYSADLLYYISKNIDEGERLNSLSKEALFREIGKLEARLENKKATKAVLKTSNAPAPVPKLKGASTAASRMKTAADFRKGDLYDFSAHHEAIARGLAV